jgi:hypothetical protein
MKMILLSLALIVAIVSCEINLSQEQAEELLRSHATIRNQIFLKLTPSLTEKGIKAGLFSKASNDLWHSDGVEIGPSGSLYFGSVQGSLSYGAECILREPLQRQITEITGLTALKQSPSFKEVTFAWKYRKVPEGLMPVVYNANGVHHGRALIQFHHGYWQVIHETIKMEGTK